MNDFMKVLQFYKIPVTSEEEKIVCPFHPDKNASLKLNINDNFFFCFGCGASGDAYKFHKLYQNKLGVSNEIKILQLFSKIKKQQIVNEKFINGDVKVEVKNRAYYRQRLIEAKDDYAGLKTVDWYDADDECVEYMLWRGFKRSTLNKAKAKYTYNDITYPIVFPVMDNGKFKGWVKRTFDIDIGKKRKYLYNKGFRRLNTIAGDYKDAEVVMLVEGFMDMLKIKQFGMKHVGAILGWKITRRQIEKLQEEGVKIIISGLDNDKCGRAGTRYLKQYFKVIRFPYPSYVKDAGEISKKDFIKAKKAVELKLKRRNLEWE